MTTVIFYEKPGCVNNTRQKMLLAAAGHTVLAKNLLTENWKRERLLSFFGSLPVAEWFNRAAPRVKSGEIVPEALSAETALALLQADPLLVRRPLIETEDLRVVGFDAGVIDAWLGLKVSPSGDLERCPSAGEPCP
jgi:nitrogenase-associated protein